MNGSNRGRTQGCDPPNLGIPNHRRLILEFKELLAKAMSGALPTHNVGISMVDTTYVGGPGSRSGTLLTLCPPARMGLVCRAGADVEAWTWSILALPCSQVLLARTYEGRLSSFG